MGRMITLDVAHPPMRSDEVELQMDKLLRELASSGETAALKVIHGYGSGGKGGILKETVLNWAYRNRARIHKTIDGSSLGLTNRDAESLLKALSSDDRELLTSNPGMTIVWINE